MTYVISVVFIFSNIPKLFLRLAVSTHLEETSRNYGKNNLPPININPTNLEDKQILEKVYQNVSGSDCLQKTDGKNRNDQWPSYAKLCQAAPPGTV